MSSFYISGKLKYKGTITLNNQVVGVIFVDEYGNIARSTHYEDGKRSNIYNSSYVEEKNGVKWYVTEQINTDADTMSVHTYDSLLRLVFLKVYDRETNALVTSQFYTYYQDTDIVATYQELMSNRLVMGNYKNGTYTYTDMKTGRIVATYNDMDGKHITRYTSDGSLLYIENRNGNIRESIGGDGSYSYSTYTKDGNLERYIAVDSLDEGDISTKIFTTQEYKYDKYQREIYNSYEMRDDNGNIDISRVDTFYEDDKDLIRKEICTTIRNDENGRVATVDEYIYQWVDIEEEE